MNVASAHSEKLSSELTDILIGDMEIANYELMVAVTAGDSADGFVKKLEGFLADAKVFNLKTERLGKKPLAYQIAKQMEGEYVLFTFEAPTEAPQSILTKLKLEQEGLLRYLITRVKETTKVRESKVTKVSEVSKVTNESKESDVKVEKKTVAKVEVKAVSTKNTDKKTENTGKKKPAAKLSKVKGKG